MTWTPVEDPADERLEPFRLRERGLASRSERREPAGAGRFAAEGDLVVERALAAGCRPVALLCRADRPPPWLDRIAPDVPVYGAADALRQHVTGLGVPLDVVGIFERPSRREVADVVGGARRLVVVEAVDNPTNLGAIIRTATGLGWDGLLLDGTSADPLARRAVRTSMGAVFSLRWARTGDLAATLEGLRDAGMLTIALTPAGSEELRHLDRATPRVALVLGAERAGLSEQTLSVCDVRARISMSAGVDSLNVAAAAAIACHHLAP